LLPKTDRARLPWFTVFAAAFAVGLSGALMPGPLAIVTLNHAARTGWLAGVLTASSHALLELLMVLGLMLGLGQVLRRRRIAGTMALAGGAVLIWMAWGMVTTAPTAALPSPAAAQAGLELSLSAPLSGIVATLSNPYWFVWWVSVGATQLAWAQSQTRGGMLTFWSGHVLSDLLWLTLLSVAVSTGRHILTEGLYRGLLYAMGAGIGLLGLFFALSAHRLYHGQINLNGGTVAEE